MLDLDKFFTNLSPTKLFIVGIFTTSLFWYLDIFLFNKTLIKGEQVQIPIVLSLCLGFVMSVVGSFTGMLTQIPPNIVKDKEKEIDQSEKKKTQSNAFLYNLFSSPCLLAMLTFIQFAGTYYFPNFHRSTFTEFILYTFYALGSIIIYHILKTIIIQFKIHRN